MVPAWGSGGKEAETQSGKTIADGQARRFAEGTAVETKKNSADLCVLRVDVLRVNERKKVVDVRMAITRIATEEKAIARREMDASSTRYWGHLGGCQA